MDSNASRPEPRWMSWAEWKAEALNRLFQRQGVLKQRARFTAVELARHGQTSPDLPPTGVEPTPERAEDLDRRLSFIRANIRPYLNN